MDAKIWHAMDAAEALRELGSDAAAGLSEDEARRRLAEHGPNALIERGGRSPWRIVWEQLTSVMVVVLILAAILSAVLGDLEDTVVILAIVVLNTILGFSQEYRAERAMAALKQLAVPSVRVRRGGGVHDVPAHDLVPGDLVLLEAGNRVPADARLIESANLRAQEAALTGESEPVEKQTAPLEKAGLPLGDRRNMVYLGTAVTYGRGVAVVTATGMETELGKVADLLQAVAAEPSPLQRRLDQLGRVLAAVALAIVAVVFVLGWTRGDELRLLLLTAVSLAVAAVPEGLPAVVTIALALGAQRMLQRQALIRKLPAVETLGSVTVICSDKTGTLTENRMTVTVLTVSGARVDVPGDRSQPPPVDLSAQPPLALLLAGGSLCNDAIEEPAVDRSGAAPGAPRVVGDPTETAFVVAAERVGLLKVELERLLPRVAEVPFDSERKRMTTVHRRPEGGAGGGPAAAVLAHLAALAPAAHVVFSKGAVDSLLEVCGTGYLEGRVVPMTPEIRQRVTAANDALAQEGMRVLGVAFRPLDAPPEGTNDQAALERDLILVGMVGMIDPARPEVKEAVRTCREAGIRPVMITGDHPLTARAIARELGIEGDSGDRRALTGQDLEHLSDEELEATASEASIFARVSPEHKLRIVKALQKRGQIVAMTGDGVNDAPALRQADIGVAMGITGTDVAKEAADMVLRDDNFATIVAAVAEGRAIYANIRKFIRYILTGNFGEIWTMLLAPFLGMPLPLLPIQILWVNLVTDGLPALALGVEPAEPDVMRQPPRPPSEHVLGRGMGWRVAWAGVFLGSLALGVGFWYFRSGDPGWQTMVFTTLTFGQMAGVLAIRSEREPLFRLGLLSNKPLLGAVALTGALQLAVIYTPFLQRFFETRPLSPEDLAISLGLSVLLFLGIEMEKWITRRRQSSL